MEMVNNGKHVLAGDYQGVGEDYNIDAGADEKTNKKKVKYLVFVFSVLYSIQWYYFIISR